MARHSLTILLASALLFVAYAIPLLHPHAASASSCGLLDAGATLTPGQMIKSCSGVYTLYFQTDGNVVLYKGDQLTAANALWSTATNGKAATTFTMQNDGNLVLYANTTALWASSWNGGKLAASSVLKVGDDGSLTITSPDGSVQWLKPSSIIKTAILNARPLDLATSSVQDLITNYWQGSAGSGNIFAQGPYGINAGGSSDPLWAGGMMYNALYYLYKIAPSDDLLQRLKAQWSFVKSQHTLAELTACGAGSIAQASDDAGWAGIFFLQAYDIARDKMALDAAKGILNCSTARWENSTYGGGLRYSDTSDNKSSYTVALALTALDIYRITGDTGYLTTAERLHDWMYSHLLRSDNLYWVDYGPDAGGGYSTWPISTPLRPTFGPTSIFGNTGMALIEARLYKITNNDTYRAEAVANATAILAKEVDLNKVFIDDRDAFTNATFVIPWVQEVLPLSGIPSGLRDAITTTAKTILSYDRTSDAHYGGTWTGPAVGSAWDVTQNVGMFAATQIPVSATAVSMVVAGVALNTAPVPVPPAPLSGTSTLTFTVATSTDNQVYTIIITTGQSYTIEWRATSVTKCTLSSAYTDGTTNQSYDLTPYPSNSNTFTGAIPDKHPGTWTMNCTGTDGTSIPKTVTITAVAPPPPTTPLDRAKNAIQDLIANCWSGDAATGHFECGGHWPVGLPNAVFNLNYGQPQMLYDAFYSYLSTTGDSETRSRLKSAWTFIKAKHTAAELAACGEGTLDPKLDDSNASVMMYIEAYDITLDPDALTAAKGLIDCVSQPKWLDNTFGGGAWYSDGYLRDTQFNFKTYINANMALNAIYLYERTNDTKYLDLSKNLYKWMHTNMLRQDGIYWWFYGTPAAVGGSSCANGASACAGGGHSSSDPRYTSQITTGYGEAGLISDMAMDILGIKLFNITGDSSYKQQATDNVNAILTRLVDSSGRFVDAGDASGSAQWVAPWIRDVLSLSGMPLSKAQDIFNTTALSILANDRTVDGYYGGDWEGPVPGGYWDSVEDGTFKSNNISVNANAVLMVEAPAVFNTVSFVPTPAPACGTLASGASLSLGGVVNSCNGRYGLIFQKSDGNVVEYDNTKQWPANIVWTTNSNGAGGTALFMQKQGNLVLYNASNVALWAYNWYNGNMTASSTLKVGDDGSLTIASPSGAVQWTTLSSPPLSKLTANPTTLANSSVQDLITNYWIGDAATGHIGGHDPFFNIDIADNYLWTMEQMYNAMYYQYKLTNSSDLLSRLKAEWNYVKSQHTLAQLTACGDGTFAPHSDDSGAANFFYLEAYDITGDSTALDAAKGILKCTLDRWEDSTYGGGIWIDDTHDAKGIYAVPHALVALDLYRISGDQSYLTTAERLHDWLYSHLLRGDGIYWTDCCTVSGSQLVSNWSAHPLSTPFMPGYGASALFGNTGMGILEARLYKITNDDKYRTEAVAGAQGILKEEVDRNGVFIDDRDASGNAGFMVPWVQEVLPLSGIPSRLSSAIATTSATIVANDRTSDGHYGGTWTGPAIGSEWDFVNDQFKAVEISVSADSVSMVVAGTAFNTAPVIPPSNNKLPTVPGPIPTDTAGLINYLYACVLKRAPTSGELSDWKSKFINDKLSLESVYRDLFLLDEYTSKQTSDSDYVESMYQCILFRAPDSSGQADWVSKLSNGYPRFDELLQFLASNEFKNTDLPKLTTATGALGTNSADHTPAGPYTGTTSAATTFSSSDKVLMAVFFGWYNYPRNYHIYYSDGSTSLTHNPIKLDSSFSNASISWWEKEMTDMHEAGIDAFLIVYWGFPLSGFGPNADNYGAVGTMVQAMRDMDDKGLPHPKVGMFYDTTMLGGKANPLGRSLDLTKAADNDYFYWTIRDFWSLIPPKYWAQIDGKPITVLYTAHDTAAAWNQNTFDDVKARFATDFGGKMPYIIRDISWTGVTTDSSTEWNAAPHGININGVVQLGAGYDQTAITNHGDRGVGVIDRENGLFYQYNWNKAMNAGKNDIIIETWNELHEGSDVAESKEFARKYLDLTKQYGDQWRAGTLPDITVPCGTLDIGASLTPGQSLASCNGRYKLIFQTGGNVVLSDTNTTPALTVWSSGTDGQAATKLILQTDGNLVLLDANKVALWASSWHGGTTSKPASLKVGDDGVLTITALDKTVEWTATSSVPVTLAPANVSLTGSSGTDIDKDALKITAGTPYTIAWNATNATACSLVYTPVSGSPTTADLTANSTNIFTGFGTYTDGGTFTLTCTGTDGTGASKSVTVTAVAAPTVTLTASPTYVAPGESSVLTWVSTGATSCTGDNFTPVGTNSYVSVTPATTTTYTITCANTLGSTAEATAVVAVGTIAAAPTATITANGTTTVTVKVGDPITYYWSSTGGTSAKGTYTVDSSACVQAGTGPFDWGDGNTLGPDTDPNSIVPTCQAGHTYTITYKVTGSNQRTASATVVVHVATQAPLPPTPPPTATLTANGTTTITITTGDSFTLDWSSSNVKDDSCTISAPSVTGDLYPQSNTTGESKDTITTAGTYTYTFTCTGTDGTSVSKSVTVTAVAPPTATLTANGTTTITVSVGDPITYVWSSTNAVSAASTVTVDAPSCGQTIGPFPWTDGNTLSGTDPNGVVPSCEAGHTYTITFKVTSSNGQTASDTVIVHVNAAPSATISSNSSYIGSVSNPVASFSIYGSANNTDTVTVVLTDSSYTGATDWNSVMALANTSPYYATKANLNGNVDVPSSGSWGAPFYKGIGATAITTTTTFLGNPLTTTSLSTSRAGTYTIYVYDPVTHVLLTTGTTHINTHTTTPVLTIDQSTLTSTSGTPTITGTATGAGAVYFTAFNNYKVFNSGAITVVGGRWSSTVSPAFPAGTYSVSVTDGSGTTVFKSLTISGSNSASTITLIVCPSFSSSANCVTNGGSITVPYNTFIGASWSSTNIPSTATACTYTGSDGKAVSAGNTNAAPGWGGYVTGTNDIKLSCTDNSGIVQSAVVHVTQAASSVTLTVCPSFSSSANCVTNGGTIFVLYNTFIGASWSSINIPATANACTYTGPDGKAVSAGSQNPAPGWGGYVAVTGTSDIKLSCTDNSGTLQSAVVHAIASTASIDQSTLTSSSGSPTITGSATGATSLEIGLLDSTAHWIQGVGGYPVTSGRWSFVPKSVLTAGTYTVLVQDIRFNTLTSGTLMISTFTTLPTTPPVPTVSLTADPTSIPLGSRSSLIWVSTYADSCASPDFTASGPSGTVTITPTATTTYSITCTGSGGTSLPASATVAIVPLSATFTASIDAGVSRSNDVTIVNGSGRTRFFWSSNGGISAKGTYTTDTPACGAAGTGPFNASYPSGFVGTHLYPFATCSEGHTYIFTYTITGSSSDQTATATVTVHVLAPPPSNLSVMCGDDGKSATFSWGTVNGATSYPIRINYLANDNSSSSCTDGWLCPATPALDFYSDSVPATTYTQTGLTPNQLYNWWVHAIVNGVWTKPASGGNFTCTAPGTVISAASQTPLATAGPIQSVYASNSLANLANILTALKAILQQLKAGR